MHGRWYEQRGQKPWHVPPERCAQYLAERQPVFDLVRSWCRDEAMSRFDERLALRTDVRRLREVVYDAAMVLERHDLKSEARRLRPKPD